MKLKIITGIAFVLIGLMVACQSDKKIEFDRYYAAGSLIYQQKCQNCHGANGEGLQALIPPLTDSVYLKNNKAALSCAIKFGLKGKITILNKAFDGQMPANDLPPVNLAEVLTYVGNSFGNKLGTIPVEQVNADISNCR